MPSVRHREIGQAITNALPITDETGTVLTVGSQVPLVHPWYRLSAESPRWSPSTHSRPLGTVTGPNLWWSSSYT